MKSCYDCKHYNICNVEPKEPCKGWTKKDDRILGYPHEYIEMLTRTKIK